MLEFLGTTRLEPSLQYYDDTEFEPGLNPEIMLEYQGFESDADLLIEWAARTCYRSNPSFQSNPKFVEKVIQRGHLDVMEHASVIVGVKMLRGNAWSFIAETRIYFPYMYIMDITNIDQDNMWFIMYGNLRAWYDFMKGRYPHSTLSYLESEDYYALEQILKNVSPRIFGEPILKIQMPELQDGPIGKLVQLSPDIMMLARTAVVENVKFYPHYGFNFDARQATFQLSNVSRAFTHQHVRHRVLSHSQESQRYVGMEDEDIVFVLPETFDKSLKEYVTEHLTSVEETYKYLRDKGAKKEDARVVLPNCTATKIISSGFMGGWKHYFDLRRAKDAQYEIRVIADSMHDILHLVGIDL